MDNKKLIWCLRLKEGLRIVKPNIRLTETYLKEAKASLKRAEKDYEDGDLLWATVVIYYADYYALYSFLQRIGVKRENHSCSILAAGFLLGRDNIRIITQHKNKRIDAQYYMKTGKEAQIKQMLREAKIFVSMFDELVSNLGNDKINAYRTELNRIKKLRLKKEFKQLSGEIEEQFKRQKLTTKDVSKAIGWARKK